MRKKKENGQAQEVDAVDVEQAPAADEAGTDAPPAPEAAVDAETIAALLEQRTLELAQTKDQLLRQAAEFQNYRRRTDREKASLVQRGQAQVIEPLLGILDDFRRSLDASAQVEQQEDPGPAYQALKAGVELVYQNFSDALRRLGVEPIEAVGRPFDENEHEALMQQPAPDDTASGTVLHELQRGYRLGDRILRHAKVVVAA